MLRSRDGGATWTNAGGPAAWGDHRLCIRHLWTDPTSPRHLFVAPADGGLFENRLSD